MLMPPYDWVPPRNEKWWSWDILITFRSANVPKNGGVGGGGKVQDHIHTFSIVVKKEKRRSEGWGESLEEMVMKCELMPSSYT